MFGPICCPCLCLFCLLKGLGATKNAAAKSMEACGPMYLMFVYGFWKQKSWIRVPGLLYSGALTYSMLYYIWIQLADPDQTGLVSEHPIRFLLFNGPYLLVPILLGFRLRKASVF